MKSYYKIQKPICLNNQMINLDSSDRQLLTVDKIDDNCKFSILINSNSGTFDNIPIDTLNYFCENSYIQEITEDAFQQETYLASIETYIKQSQVNDLIKTKLLRNLNLISAKYCNKKKTNIKKIFFKN